MQIVLNLANHLDTTRTKKSLNIDKQCYYWQIWISKLLTSLVRNSSHANTISYRRSCFAFNSEKFMFSTGCIVACYQYCPHFIYFEMKYIKCKSGESLGVCQSNLKLPNLLHHQSAFVCLIKMLSLWQAAETKQVICGLGNQVLTKFQCFSAHQEES